MKNQSQLASSVMSKIKSGQIKMRPKSYFITLGAITFLATVLSAAAMSYCFNIVFFWFRIVSSEGMAWGARANLNQLVVSFPWWALGLASLSIGMTAWLVKIHGSTHRHTVNQIISLIVIGSLLLGLIVSTLNLPQSKQRHAPRVKNFNSNGTLLK